MTEKNKFKKTIQEFAIRNDLGLNYLTREKHFETSIVYKKELRQYHGEKKPKEDMIQYWCCFWTKTHDDGTLQSYYQLCSKPAWDRANIYYDWKFYDTLENLQFAWDAVKIKNR